MTPELSILIVHYNTPRLLRQTLKGIFRATLTIPYEVIVVDNNPQGRVAPWIAQEFPDVRVILQERNVGFGSGMNAAFREAQGTYVYVFNPDAIVLPGSLETLVSYLKEHADVGIVAPQLLHPDGSVQSSCFRFASPSVIFYRRFPLARFFSRARRAVKRYLMEEWDHQDTRDVDYVLGAAMCLRRTFAQTLGGFDPKFFLYFEEQDLCRRCWASGHRVVYHPRAKMIHYYRRETAEGNFFQQLFHPLTSVQLQSALYYYRKHGRKPPAPVS
jgi:GT2 family glycosyltransferase